MRMSWELTIKASTSKSAKIVWPSMKNLIDKFFEIEQEYTTTNLRNYLINNLENQLTQDRPDLSSRVVKTNVAVALKDLKSEGDRTKYMSQKVPRYIKTKYKRTRRMGHQIYGNEYLPIEKSWNSTLKSGASRSESRKLVEQTIKEMLAEFLEGKDEISTPEIKQYIIDNLKEEHIKRHNVDGKVTAAISSAPTRYIQNRLDSHIKNKIPIMVKNLGYENKYATSFQGSQRQIGGGHSYFIKKADSWESMVDSMIAQGKLFEEIYTAILQKYKFSAPSKENVVAYLNANYKRHPLFSNKWNTKGEGE